MWYFHIEIYSYFFLKKSLYTYIPRETTSWTLRNTSFAFLGLNHTYLHIFQGNMANYIIYNQRHQQLLHCSNANFETVQTSWLQQLNNWEFLLLILPYGTVWPSISSMVLKSIVYTNFMYVYEYGAPIWYMGLTTS